MAWIDESPEIEALLLAMEMAMALTSLLNKRNDNIDRNNSHPPQTSTKSQGMKPPLSILPSTSAPTTLLLLSLNELTPSYNQFPWLKRNKNVSMSNNNVLNNNNNSNNVLNDNNNNVWNNKNGNTLIQHGNRKSQILETIHGTNYTATTNQSITSNQHFTTKPKESKLLKILDESWESTETLIDTYKFLNESWEPTEKSSDTYRYIEKPTVSISPQPHISYNLTQRVSTTTQSNGNDKYTRRIYVPVTTPKLKSIHIDNNFHSQHLSSVLKITNKNNNNNINFQ